MISSYLTLTDSESKIVVSKSEFISFIYAIDSEADALKRLESLRKKYYDASHICYGYIADEEGNILRSSDDGEPSGSGGQPILDCIKKGGFRKVLAAVVRYFGGTKLGVGGLVRAYGEATKKTIDNSQIKVYTLCNVYKIKADYKLYNNEISNMFNTAPINQIKTEFLDDVEITVAVKKDFDLLAALKETTKGKDRVSFIESKYLEL